MTIENLKTRQLEYMVVIKWDGKTPTNDKNFYYSGYFKTAEEASDYLNCRGYSGSFTSICPGSWNLESRGHHINVNEQLKVLEQK